MAEANELTPEIPPQVESHGRLMDTVERRAKLIKTAEIALIALLCLGLVGFLLYRGISSGKSVDQTDTASVHRSQVVGSGSQSDRPEDPSLASLAPKPYARRDPFEPLIVAEEPGGPAAGPRRSVRIGSIPPVGPGIFGVSRPPELPNLQTRQEPPSGKSLIGGLQVTGIIYGEPSVAILREGNSERHYVREGDRVKENVYVKSIQRGRVILRAGVEDVVLTLGGKKDAS